MDIWKVTTPYALLVTVFAAGILGSSVATGNTLGIVISGIIVGYGILDAVFSAIVYHFGQKLLDKLEEKGAQEEKNKKEN